MRTIGLLGGMSWESSAVYYRIVNETVRDRLGGSHSARCVLVSVDFAEVEALQRAGDWQAAAALMVRWAQAVEAAGGECLVICTNTMHRMADSVAAAIDIPLLHIADTTAVAIAAAGVDTVGLLGTRYTMEQDFYRGRLETLHGLRVLVPPSEDRSTVHSIIYDELVRGIVDEESRLRALAVIDRLVAAGARGIIAGCTEIELLVGPGDVSVPYFPTTRLHAEAAVDWALRDGPLSSG